MNLYRSIPLRVVPGYVLGDCHAASTLDAETGDALVMINADTFPRLTAAQQQFIVAHEIGHLTLQTDSETKADAFALGMTAGRARRSLKEALRAVASMEAVPAGRLQALLDLCAYVDRHHK